MTPPDPYAEGKASGYAIGYLGCFALFFILIPDVLVWLIAGVLLHTPILGLVGLYIALPIALYQLWQTYQRWRWKRAAEAEHLMTSLKASLKATRKRASDTPADDEPPVTF